jgi:hypothetical protein
MPNLTATVPAFDVTDRTSDIVMLAAGLEYSVELGKFEWLGHEGMYAEISLPSMPGRRFRVRRHQLGNGVLFRPKTASNQR